MTAGPATGPAEGSCADLPPNLALPAYRVTATGSGAIAGRGGRTPEMTKTAPQGSGPAANANVIDLPTDDQQPTAPPRQDRTCGPEVAKAPAWMLAEAFSREPPRRITLDGITLERRVRLSLPAAGGGDGAGYCGAS
jgi:hypothetical protein